MTQNEMESMQSQLNTLNTSHWYNHELFTSNWWIILLFNFVLFGLLILLADRRRTSTIAVAFLIALAIVGTFDETGTYMGRWIYPYEFLPFSARLNAVNFLAIPSIIALVYQWFTRWSSFLLATVIYSILNSYIGEPIFVHLGIYKLTNWTYTGSFLVMLLIPIVVKYLTDVISQNRASNKNDLDLNINWLRRKEKIH
ncbi:CBO0543 family protein [Paenibacillus oryzisoli]|uniref:CBO0543 family protein n=1 Tax=Paenibacillus oryzisoli TaxID=1850517 RepID=UPI003D29FBAA